MTSHDSRLGALEAWREAHDREIADIKKSLVSMDGKLDDLVAAKGAASWLAKGFMPALWALLASGVTAFAAVKWH